MISCAVYGCANNAAAINDPTIQYYYFPKHPVIAQQWLSACWRADPIDLNSAQICSIHFDIDSYTSEYKMLDYLGHYTRILKYDAIPTLYLPNLQTPVIMKATLNEPVPILTEIKDILVYQVQEETSTSYDATSVKDFVHTESMGNVPEIDPIYKQIVNNTQLENLKFENAALRKSVQQLEEANRCLQTQISEKAMEYKTKQEEMKKAAQQYDHLHCATMSMKEHRNVLSKVFSESQIKILSGKKKIYWSNDDMAVGYTIRHLSNKRCYMYLSKKLNIPLPALSSLKRWSTLKKNEFEKEEKTGSKNVDDEFSD